MSTPCEREAVLTWNYADIQDPAGKSYMLRFLPYLDGFEPIGYVPRWVPRGYGYGRWEEFFATRGEAEVRMRFLTASGAIEDIALHEELPGGGIMTRILEEWVDKTPPSEDSEDPA